MIKQKRGYSLGVLVITITVMIILTTTALLSFRGMTSDKEITNFMNDITEVEEYVKEYYGEKRVLPLQYSSNMPVKLLDVEYQNIRIQVDESDVGDYYYIDLTKLERIHLKDKDRGYVVNEGSLKIYVVKPVVYQGITYYTVTDELKGNEKTYNDANFEVLISGNPLTWSRSAKLILSVPDIFSEQVSENIMTDGWVFKYYEDGPITADEFKNNGRLFLYGETIEIKKNGIISFYVENPEGHAKVRHVVVSMIDDIAPTIKLNGDNTRLGKLIITDEETGINPDRLLYKIEGYDTDLENSKNGRDILFYGVRYTEYIEKYSLLEKSYEDILSEINTLKTLGSGENELTDLTDRLNSIGSEIDKLNSDNRDFNDGTKPYGDEEANIVVYVEDYAENMTKCPTVISRNVLINSNLIDFEARPLDNSTFGIIKTSQYTNENKVNLRIQSQGATHMLITLDSTLSPTDLSNYETYDASNGDYEFNISGVTGEKITIYAYFTAGEYDKGNLIYNSFSDSIIVDKEAPTNDAPGLKISNTLELDIIVNQKDSDSGIVKIEYGYSEDEDINSFTWRDTVNEIEQVIQYGKKYYIRTRAKDALGNGPTVSEYAVLQCPTKKIIAVPNVPKLGNMQAITWDSNLEEIEIDKTTYKDKNDVTRVWYDYVTGNGRDDTGMSKWANARSTDGSYWVWIPRYAYKIIYYTDSSKTEVKGYYKQSSYTGKIDYYLPDGKTISPAERVKSPHGDIDIVFLYGAEDDRYLDLETNQLLSLRNGGTELYSEYIVHPAFKSASVGVNSLGTWENNNLTGIWVAKFEASRVNASYSSEGTTKAIKVVPTVRSLDDITVSEAYDYSASMVPSMNSHLMKNSEWGAVAYLAHSAYGRNGHTISQNLSSDMITGGGTASSGSTYATAAQSTFEDRYGYQTSAGFRATTTNNIYGIYDMVGGAAEYVAAYINNEQLNDMYASSLKDARSGFAQIYTKATSDTSSNNYSVNSNIYGDAIQEVSLNENLVWSNDSIIYPTNTEAIFVRGGSYNEEAGVFNVNKSTGEATIEISFRPVLAP